MLEKFDNLKIMQKDISEIKSCLSQFLSVIGETKKKPSDTEEMRILNDMGHKVITLADFILEDRAKQKVQDISYRFRRQNMKKWAITKNKRKTEAYHAIRNLDLAQIFTNFIESKEVYIPKKFRQYVKQEASDTEIQRAYVLEKLRMVYEIDNYKESAAKHASKVEDLDKIIHELIMSYQPAPEDEHLVEEVHHFLSKLWEQECIKEENTSKIIWERKRQWFLNLPYNEEFNNFNKSPSTPPQEKELLKKVYPMDKNISIKAEKSPKRISRPDVKIEPKGSQKRDSRISHGVKKLTNKPIRIKKPDDKGESKKSLRISKPGDKEESKELQSKGSQNPPVVKSKELNPKQIKMKREINELCRNLNVEFKPTLGATMLMEEESPFERPPEEIEVFMEGAFLYLKKKKEKNNLLNDAEKLFFLAYMTFKISAPKNGQRYDDAASAKLYVMYMNYIERDQEADELSSQNQEASGFSLESKAKSEFNPPKLSRAI